MTPLLADVKVVDFSRIFAAPDSTQTLGDLGADVIKIEQPNDGDSCRQLGVTRQQLEALDGGASPSFLAFNRNKRSVVIDLSSTAGQEIARRLVADSDVVVNNFRPGTMERWGLDYESLRDANPRLIYCDFYAYGAVGPMAHVGANDLALQAHSGLMSITGEEGGPPVRAGSAIIDLHASLAIVAGILAALLHREKTGRGQRVETSLLRSSAHLMSYFYQDYWLTGHMHRRLGTANHLSVPNQMFPAVDGFVIIIAPTDEMWKRCASALDPSSLDLPAFEKADDRLRRRADVVAAMSAVTSRMTKAEIVDRLAAVKVNVSIVQDIGEAAQDPQLAAIGGVLEFEEEGGSRKYVAMPFHLSESPPLMRKRPPRLDEHTDEVLGEMGYGADSLEALRAQGVIGCR